MKVKIDRELCTGNGRCWHYAPKVYDLDDNGYNKRRGEEYKVPAGEEESAEMGAASCPEQAIKIIE